MDRLLTIYHENIPDFLREFAGTPLLRRLRSVGMNCGCEYTSFPRFQNLQPYSRFDHSLGVALILWHFTGDMAQSLAGLFHDAATPVFSHVVDFLHGDHLCQESTEEGTADRIAGDGECCRLLEKYGLSLAQVADYHIYPLADNPSPALSADRLEYTLGNLYNYGFASLDTIRDFYTDLTIGTDEREEQELVFRTPALASAFAAAALKNAYVYVADEDRFAMESLALLLRKAMERDILTEWDLWKTEPEVIRALQSDPACSAEWVRYQSYSRLLRRDSRPGEDGWLRIDAKKRWIDPLAIGCGRVSRWDVEVRRQIDAFCALDFNCWLSAE